MITMIEKLEECPGCGEVKRWLYDAQMCAACDHGNPLRTRAMITRERLRELQRLHDGAAPGDPLVGAVPALIETIEALAEVLEGTLKYEQASARLAGFADCTCINHSREMEIAYETGGCPHQRARALLAQLDPQPATTAPSTREPAEPGSEPTNPPEVSGPGSSSGGGKYRKKPVEIEAIRATGTPESNRQIIDWTRGSNTPAYMDRRVTRLDDGNTLVDDEPALSINTLEGALWVAPGDWIIKGVKGEFYPCKPDIFEQTYEPVEDR